jgi:hypothetical protein
MDRTYSKDKFYKVEVCVTGYETVVVKSDAYSSSAGTKNDEEIKETTIVEFELNGDDMRQAVNRAIMMMQTGTGMAGWDATTTGNDPQA